MTALLVANNLSWGSSGLGSTTKQLEACFSSNNVSTVLNRVKSVIFSHFLIFSQPAVNRVGKVWQSLAKFGNCPVPSLLRTMFVRSTLASLSRESRRRNVSRKLYRFAWIHIVECQTSDFEEEHQFSINSAIDVFWMYQSAVSISCAVQTDYARWSQGPAKDVFPVKGTQGTEGTEGRAHAV